MTVVTVGSRSLRRTLFVNTDVGLLTYEKEARNALGLASTKTIRVDRPPKTTIIRSNGGSFQLPAFDLSVNERFGYDSQTLIVFGTGSNNAPTGATVFSTVAGHTLNGGTEPVTFSAPFTSPPMFAIWFDAETLDYRVSRVGA